MLYAADLGPCGLDTSDLVNRDAVLDVYASQCSSCIDSTDPFLPEWSSIVFILSAKVIQYICTTFNFKKLFSKVRKKFYVEMQMGLLLCVMIHWVRLLLYFCDVAIIFTNFVHFP